MKAVGLYRYLPIDHPDALLDLDVETPVAEARELLVEVKAVSVNPLDTKQRAPKDTAETTPRILGWDAAGVVRAAGPEATLFSPGDEVYYAGSIVRPGANCEFQLVDERIVGRKPATLSFAEAAALPLTTITAWELMFERMGISKSGAHAGRSLLILGGAGGVGSIAIQLAKRLAKLKVIATASRPESTAWVRSLGADATIDHTRALPEQLQALGEPEVDYVVCFSDTDRYFAEFPRLVKPQGRIGSIVRNARPVDLALLQPKSLAFSWEGMFTRSSFGTADMIAQHELLCEAAALVEVELLRSTLKENLGSINAANLKRAHQRLEQGHVVGKLVLEGF
ncbi:MAG: NADPH:quinone reductase [Betaproteobacteria bacterium RIFCSPLOWO2_02_67_12]|nr:MAG: NADPH:quinone reductase [Betaproteobacteria bacterium RIFCSPLOWO2_02_67_12]OGA29109.1 MAG: NADPH:quinone reductase [Betaproteobacteria bacterium RIFCSPLOWO2_02_FULL_68_150]